jgi:PAS domain S-box-containing protein
MYSSTIVTINKSGLIQSVDKNCCKLFGYEFEELIGHPVQLIIPPPYKEQHDTYLKNYDATKIPKIIGKSRIVEGQHKDGSIFPIRLSVSKIGEGDDTIFIGMIDKMEDKSASVTINTNGNIVSCNQNVEELFGYKANELIGQNINVVMPSPHKEKHDSYLRSYLGGAAAKVIGKVRNVAAMHKSGNVFPISLQVEQLKVGSIILFRGKIEKVDLMEAMFTIDENGVIVSCNQNFTQPLFGYSNAELIGKPISTLIPHLHQNTHSIDVFAPSKEPERKKQKLENVPASTEYSWKTPGVHKKEVLHKDGSTFPVVLEIYPFADDRVAEPKSQFSVRIKRADFEKDQSSEHHKMIGNYYVVKTVGQGSYGKVKLATHKDTKENVAIKILHKIKMKPQELERAKRETEILHKLKHSNIARLIDVIETDEVMYIIMEFAGRTLLSYVLERGGLGEAGARKFFNQISSAVKYCHDLNIIHRDIKHQNILLDDQDNTKLIDFGLSNFMEEGKLRSTFCGTPAYAAPEMILGKKYSGPEVDIWSLGVVLYSMITGVFPFENVADIIRGTFKNPKDASPECCDLISKMLQVDIATRITLDGILQHPWCTADPKAVPKSSEAVKEIECLVVSTNPTDTQKAEANAN